MRFLNIFSKQFIRHYFSLFILFLLFFNLIWAESIKISKGSGNPVDIEFYQGSIEKFKIETPLSNQGYGILFSGSTKYKVLWFRIVKKDSSVRHDIKFYTGASGSSYVKFSKFYVFKEGPGLYKITIYGAMNKSTTKFTGIAEFSVNSSEVKKDMKELYLNSKILEYVNSVMGKTVARGECWDLAQQALDKYSADWIRTKHFGLPLDPDRDEILPGDIIQFLSVKLTERLKNGGTRYTSIGSPDHTAIIYKVLGKRNYILAHQNINGKRYVITSEINLNNITSGKFWIYRPQAGFLDVKY